MEYRVLGPVQVWVQGRRLVLPRGKRCDLLAVLLLHPGRVVSVERLIELLWGEVLPRAPTTALQGVVSGLRRVLAPGHPGSSPLVTQGPGYRLDVCPGELDLDRFNQLVADARRHLGQGAAVEAVEQLRAALALWRGPPLGGVRADELVHVQVPRLAERRLAAVEDYMDAELAVGAAGDLVAELEGYVAAYPLRERLRGQLMVALYRAGRQADALEVYRRGRAKLADELGLDPGGELQRTQQAVLRADPSLEAPAESAGQATAGVAVSAAGCRPAQLPADLADFTGRGQQVDAVCELVTGEGSDRSAAVRVAVVAGQAGVGKTALAVHAAHRMQASFPDGQLYVDLRGAEACPLGVGEVLGWFLRGLGVSPGAVPESVDERAQAYRSLLAGRRVLVVLDNAAGETQARPLLPGSPSCAVVVTSRRRLTGLEGASSVDLEVFDPEQAAALLARLAGPQRVAGEPQAAEEIVRWCGYLPLAVRVAGARLAAHPHWGLGQLAGRLADQRERLDELASGDLDVRASVELSYTELDPQAAQALRMLGLVDTGAAPVWVPATLLDVSLRRAGELVDTLARARLVDTTGPDAVDQLRYRAHDLIRDYARERAAEEPEAVQRAALQRMLGGYLHLVDQAAARMPAAVPYQQRGRAPRVPLDPAHVGRLICCPRTWFQSEQAGLVSAVQQAAAWGFDELAWELCAALVPGFFLLDSRFDEWQSTHQAALAVTRHAGNRRGEAVTLYGLGLLQVTQARLGQADQYLRPALRALREVGSPRGEAAVLGCLGVVWHLWGRLRDAEAFFHQARLIFTEHHDPHAAACVAIHLGALLHDRGRCDEALAHLQPALDTFHAAADRRGQARALLALGWVHQAQNQLDRASELFDLAQHTAGEIADRRTAAYTTEARASTHIHQRRAHLAEPLLASCLEEFQQLHDPYGQARTLTVLGQAHHAQHRPDQAHECLHTALAHWEQLQLPLGQARTLHQLGTLHMALGEPHTAQGYWHQALALVHQLDVPEAAQLATQLPRRQ